MTDHQRNANRHGQNAPPTLVRYEVYSKLSDYHAEAYMVWFEEDISAGTGDPQQDYETANEGNHLKITVYSVNGQQLGDVGSRGWAVFNCDSLRYEVLNAAGESTLAVVTIEGTSGGYSAGDETEPFGNCLFKGKVTAIADEGYCDEEPYTLGQEVWVLVLDRPGGSSSADPKLIVGDRFLAKKVVSEFTIGEGEFADERPVYAINKRGGAGSNLKIVTATDDEADSGNCLWPGAVVIGLDPSDEEISFCTDPSDISTECWILVLNSDLGSFATAKTRLVIGEQYIGFYLGDHHADDKPVYAIRIENNQIYHVTLSGNIAAGMTGTVTLPINGGLAVTARNWSDVDYLAGDKVSVYQDLTNNQWYAIKAGGASTMTRLVKTTTTHPPDTVHDVNVWVGTPGSEVVSTGPIVLSATNKSTRTIPANSFCLATLTNVADAGDPNDFQWYIIPLSSGTGARLFKGTLTGSLSSSSGTIGLSSVIAYDNGSTPGTLTANNVLALAAPSSSIGIVVLDEASGEYDLINVRHVVRPVVTDMAFTGTQLTVDLKSLVTMDDNDDQDDLEVFTVVQQVVVYDVYLDGLDLKQITGTVTVFAATLGDEGLIVEGDNCPEE